MITFLSKAFINKLICCLEKQVQTSIATEVKQAFSLEVDSTQDVAVLDQLAICVRYVHNGRVKTRLLSVLVAKKIYR